MAELKAVNLRISEAQYSIPLFHDHKSINKVILSFKKIICGYIIKNITVCSNYWSRIALKTNAEQFLNGIGSIQKPISIKCLNAIIPTEISYSPAKARAFSESEFLTLTILCLKHKVSTSTLLCLRNAEPGLL